MKNILLLVHDDPGQEARLQAALDIVRAVGGHLHCLDVTPMPLAVEAPYDRVGAALIFQGEATSEAKNKERLQSRLNHEDVAWSWADTVDEPSRALTIAAALADLIVVNRQLDTVSYPDMLGIAGDLLVNARRPIVAVPESAGLFDAFGHALVAWDGSAPASTAMIAAVPLLVHAAHVTLLEIGKPANETSAEQAAAYLSRYGIEARIVREPDDARLIGEALLGAVAAHRPSYVTMGGYGHTRIGESLLGGATRTMLKASPVPILLAH